MSSQSPILKTAALLSALCALGTAMAGEYLPWELNDQAGYVADTPAPAVTNGVDQLQGKWRHFSAFAGWGAQWLGSAADNERLLLFDPQLALPVLLTDFDRPVGYGRWISVQPCNQGRVSIAAKGLRLNTPAGTFDDVVELSLETSCADAGVSRMWFAPGVGLLQWTENGLAGELRYRLAQGLIDDRHYPRAGGLVLSASVPGAVAWIDMMPLVGPGPRPATRLPLSLRLSNQGAETLVYQFNSGQRYDFLLYDEAGAVVAWWSAGKAFPQVLGRISLGPGEELAFGGDFELLTPAGEPVPEGNYSLEIRLASAAAPDTAQQPGSGPPAVRLPLAVRWAY